MLITCISFTLCSCNQKDNRDYNAEFNEYVEVYKEKYNINLMLIDEENEEIHSNVKSVEPDEKMIEALEEIELVLDRFPTDFIKSLKVKISTAVIREGIDLYLGKELQGENGWLLGQTNFKDNKKYIITLDVSSNNIGNVMAHEIYHVMYNIVLEKEKYGWAKSIDEEKWNSYNPEGFIYGSEGGKKYTISDSDLKEVYFVTDYSKTSMGEDMAEIFGDLMTEGKNNKAFKSDHVKAKAKLISNMIRENFDDIGEEPYWDRLIKDVVLEGEYGVEIEESKEGDKECWKIELWNDGINFKQLITLTKDGTVLELPKREDLVLQKDINFDGYKDILICLGTYQNNIVRYEAYIWDETTKGLVYNESFKSIPNPELNEIRQEIRGGQKAEDGKYYVINYVYVNGKFVEKIETY